MASIIKIKRSGTSGSPTSLKLGEMAYSYLADNGSNGGDRLYMGTGGVDGSGDANEIEVIGGVYFTSKLDHTPGTLTASSAIIVDASSKIDVLNVDNITINANTISSTDTDGNIVLDPNGAGEIQASSAKITGVAEPTGNTHAATKLYVDSNDALRLQLAGGTMSGNIAMGGNKVTGLGTPSSANDAVTKTYADTTFLDVAGDTMAGAIAMGTNKITGMGDPTAAQDAATKAYVDATSGSSTATFGADGGSDDTFNLADSSFTFEGGTAITTTVTPASNKITFSLDNTAVSAGSFGSATSIPTFTVDQQGRLTAAGSAAVSSVIHLKADTKSGNVSLLDSSLTITGGEGIDVIIDSAGVNGSGFVVSGEDASTSNKGVASFNSSDFSVSSGAVSIKTGGVSNDQLAGSIANTKLSNSTITIDDGTTSRAVDLGDTFKFSTTEGITFTVSSSDSATIQADLATASTVGAAKFNTDNFLVTNGDVTIKSQGVNADELNNTLDLSGKSVTLAAGEISNGELANSSLTINGTSISLGGSGTIDTDDVGEGSTNLYFTTARADSDAKNAVSVTDAGGDGSLSYNATTGVFTYTGPSATEVRAHLVAGTGMTYDSTEGRFAIAQAVATTDSVRFSGLSTSGDVIVGGDFFVNGTTTTVNSLTVTTKDPLIHLADSNVVGDTVDIGFIGKYYDTSQERVEYTGLFRDASDGRFKLFTNYVDSAGLDSAINVIDTSAVGYTKADLTVGTLRADAIIGSISGFDSDFNDKSTDDLSEGSSNLYFTNERVDDRVNALITDGEAIGTVYDDGSNTLTINVDIATTSARGVASFATADFGVSTGAVSLNDAVVKSVTTNTAPATPSSHTFAIEGDSAQGVTTSGSGATVTITTANAAADGSTKGVATFNSTNFNASSGVISSENIAFTSGNDVDGDGSTLNKTLGGTLKIYGDHSQGITTSVASGNLLVAGRNATTSSKGVASFGTNADSASDPLSIKQFTITSGDVALSTVDGGTY